MDEPCGISQAPCPARRFPAMGGNRRRPGWCSIRMGSFPAHRADPRTRPRQRHAGPSSSATTARSQQCAAPARLRLGDLRRGAAQRRQSLSGQPASPTPSRRLVDTERRAQFEEEQEAHFESAYFLTLCWLPPAEDAARAEAWLYEGRARGGVDGHEILRHLHRSQLAASCKLIEGFVPDAAWLDDGETPDLPAFLHLDQASSRPRPPRSRCISTPCWSTSRLAGGLEPRLERAAFCAP